MCLTFADHLYTEIAKQICGKETQKFPEKSQVQPKLEEDMEVLLLLCITPKKIKNTKPFDCAINIVASLQ